MRFRSGRNRPSWRSPEAGVLRPGLVLGALVLVAALLVEVGQSSRMAELALLLDQNRAALSQSTARLEFVQARLERVTTRAELAPLAGRLGLAPADAGQVVALPAEFLAPDPPSGPSPEAGSLMDLAERASRVLVPEATARVRTGN